MNYAIKCCIYTMYFKNGWARGLGYFANYQNLRSLGNTLQKDESTATNNNWMNEWMNGWMNEWINK